MYRSDAKKIVPLSPSTADRELGGKAEASPTDDAGWDPFEVWRERIQRPREQSGKTALTQLDRARQKS